MLNRGPQYQVTGDHARTEGRFVPRLTAERVLQNVANVFGSIAGRPKLNRPVEPVTGPPLGVLPRQVQRVFVRAGNRLA